MEDVAHDRSARRFDSGEALVAIVFSAAMIEGFLNEAAQHVQIYLNNRADEDYPDIRAFAAIFSALEASHAQLELKLEVAGAILRGDIWLKGKQPLQDLRLLSRLRNAILHPRPLSFPGVGDDIPSRPDKLVESLRNRGIIKSPPILSTLGPPQSPPVHAYAPWIIAVQSTEVANWALQTALVGVRKG